VVIVVCAAICYAVVFETLYRGVAIMFIRIFRPSGEELLVNVDHISKIQVSYVVPGSDETGHEVDAE
jgi:hypothetical protein